MSIKKASLLLVLGLCMTCAQAAKIVWVGDSIDINADGTPDDYQWVSWLQAQGHTVDVQRAYWTTLDATKIATLNAADLIIVSRATSSGSYNTNAAEITQWSSITKPLILLNAYLVRGTGTTRWFWVNSGTINNLVGPVMQAVELSHPIFTGISLNANNQVAIVDGTTGTGQTSFIGTIDVGNGTLLARTVTGTNAWIVEWDSGNAFYAGSSQTPAAKRLLFCAGTQETAPQPQGVFNLTAEGQKLFLNAINYMLGILRRKKATNPTPANAGVVTETSLTLIWSAGGTAASHDVYLGENQANVAAGTGGTFIRNQTDAWLFVGMPGFSYPAGLQAGKTYYWRIDEVEADGVTKHTGDVWSFSLPLKTAHDPNPADGTKFVDPNADLTWTTGFGAKLHYVYFGTDQATVSSATGGAPLPLTTYDPGTLQFDKTYYWRIDEFDGANTHTGLVWSFRTIPNITVTDPNLMGWWKLDEGQGTKVVDWSGHGKHAAVNGTAQWLTDGYDGGAVTLTGSENFIEIPTATVGTRMATVCLWIKTTTTAQGMVFYASSVTGGDGYGSQNELHISMETNGQARFFIEAGTTDLNLYTGTPVNNDSWHHIAVTWDASIVKMYLNGLLVGSTPNTSIDFQFIGRIRLARPDAAMRYYSGSIDDVRLYNRVLTETDVKNAMRGDLKLAWNASPTNGSTLDIRNVSSLTWSKGDLAQQHDVYFGSSLDAVEDAATTSAEYKGRRSTMSYPLTGLITFGGGPYYWRIDEINSDSTISNGRVWRFSIADYLIIDNMEDYNNFPPDRIFETWVDGYANSSVNGSIVGHPDPDFDAGEDFAETSIFHGGLQSMPYYYNCNFKYSEAVMTLANPNRDWTQQGIKSLTLWFRGYPSTQGSLTESPAGTFTMTGAGSDIWIINSVEADEFHYAWKMLNGPGTITAKVSAITGTNLNGWAKAGLMIRETLDPNSAHAHMLLSATNGIALQYRPTAAGTSANSQQLTAVSQRPLWLKLDRDFSGTFTASYANDVGGAPDKWTAMTTTNIQMAANVYIGLALTSHQAYVQARATFSNITLAGTITGATWTNQDIGIRSNQAERLFVSIKGTTGPQAIVYNTDPQAATRNTWTEWNIPLTAFTGINLSNVDRISIGFGTRGNTSPGGSGLMYFDDIRLYKGRCFPLLVRPDADFSNNCVVDMADLDILANNWLIKNWQVTPSNPGTSGLKGQWKFENNLQDSSGNGKTGDPCGTTPTYVAGKVSQAVNLDGADYIRVGAVGISGAAPRTIAGWAKAAVPAASIPDWTDVFGFTGASGTNGHFDINRRGGQDYYCIHVYGWERNIAPLDQEWHHLSATYDGTTIKWYSDGHQAGSEDRAGLNTNDNVQIGKRSDNTNMFTGLVDEVNIYNKALSQAEVAWLAGKTTAFTQAVGLLVNPQDPKMDLSSDGQINFKDFAVLIDRWLEEKLWP
jgi:hypothetical protein